MKRSKVSDVKQYEKRISAPIKERWSALARLSDIYENAWDIGADYYFLRLAQAVYGYHNATLNAHLYLFNKYQMTDLDPTFTEVEKFVVELSGQLNVDIEDEELFQWLYSSVAKDDWPDFF